MTEIHRLQAAATLMRERAEACREYMSDPEWHTEGALLGGGKARVDAEFIASWHPAVALAVADLLDEVANGVDVMAPLDWDYPLGPMDCTGALRPEWNHALAVARAYLGEAS